jgi:hypothetical protein
LERTRSFAVPLAITLAWTAPAAALPLPIAPESGAARAQASAIPDTLPTSAAGRAREETGIAAEHAQARKPPTAAPRGAPTANTEAGGSASASSRGLSNVMNPAISANGLLLGGWTSRDGADAMDERGDLETGPSIQELEIALSAIVDPYFRADIVVAGVPAEAEIGFEEAYVTTLEIPQLNVRAGLFKAALGRHNLLHTHAFPFLTGPLPWRAFLGPEGLADAGLSLDLLVPFPFYVEVTSQVFAGEWGPFTGGIEDDPMTAVDESVPDARNPEDFAYVEHLKTLFDLSTSTTLEIGGSYLGGRNGWRGLTSLVGADVTVKWRPVDAERYQGLDWQSEWVWIDRERAPGERPVGGAYSHLRYHVDQRWWAQVRGAVLGVPDGGQDRVLRGEALAAFVPSEFSALRLQYGIERSDAPGASFTHDAFFQMVFSIGPHPAHAY